MQVSSGWEVQLVRDEFSRPLQNPRSVGPEPNMPVFVCPLRCTITTSGVFSFPLASRKCTAAQGVGV